MENVLTQKAIYVRHRYYFLFKKNFLNSKAANIAWRRGSGREPLPSTKKVTTGCTRANPGPHPVQVVAPYAAKAPTTLTHGAPPIPLPTQ